MEIIKTLCWIVQIISAISIIVLVLLQHGKGADAGATFGSGSSGSLFGATGSTNFLSRTTAIFATVFFVTTFALVMLSTRSSIGGVGVMAGLNGKVVASGPVVSKAVASSAIAKPSESGVISSAPIKGSAKNQMPN